MATETRERIEVAKQTERLRPALLARCRQVLRVKTRIAVAELANHLPPGEQAEARIPPEEDLAFIAAYVFLPGKKDHYIYVAHFRQPAFLPIGWTHIHQRDNVIIETGEIMWRKTKPQGPRSGEWEILGGRDTHAWHRIKESGGQPEEANFQRGRMAVYANKRLTEGDPSLLAEAAEALEKAFPISGPQIQSLDRIVRILWGTQGLPEKPEPPSGGGKRVPQPKPSLTPAIDGGGATRI